VAEVFAYPGDQRPLDPSGHFGYFAVYVPEGDAAHGRVYDPFLRHAQSPKASDLAVLNDAQVVGAALGLRAMDAARNRLDLDGALRDAEAAVKLLPGSPTSHGVLAHVLLARAEPEKGKAELDKALALRADGPRRNNLAIHALTHNDPMRAGRELGDTLKELPEFAYAHTTRAAASIILMAYQIAGDELRLAEKADPELPLVPQLWAQLLAAKGDLNEAVVMGRKAVQQRPNDPRPLYILARIERTLGLKDDMRKHAAQILELTPAGQRDGRKAHLQSVLGEDAFSGEGEAQASPDKL
jgi:predicted Zn-dependent protease